MNQPIFSFLALLLCLSGCAVSGKDPAAKSVRPATSAVGDDFANVPVQKVNDPLQGFNRTMFGFNDELNTHAWRPLAHGYVIVVPRPVRNGISNFFDNVQFPVRFVNSVLQGKLTRSAQEVGKFVFNSKGLAQPTAETLTAGSPESFNPNPEVETADSADFADLRSRADGLCHLQFCSG